MTYRRVAAARGCRRRRRRIQLLAAGIRPARHQRRCACARRDAVADGSAARGIPRRARAAAAGRCDAAIAPRRDADTVTCRCRSTPRSMPDPRASRSRVRSTTRARDHRLRMLFPTGAAHVDSARADTAFDVVTRPARRAGARDDQERSAGQQRADDFGRRRRRRSTPAQP